MPALVWENPCQRSAPESPLPPPTWPGTILLSLNQLLAHFFINKLKTDSGALSLTGAYK